jgi:hypothetical protein
MKARKRWLTACIAKTNSAVGTYKKFGQPSEYKDARVDILNKGVWDLLFDNIASDVPNLTPGLVWIPVCDQDEAWNVWSEDKDKGKRGMNYPCKG